MKQARKMLISMGEQSDGVCVQVDGELVSSPGPHWGQGTLIMGSIGSLRLRAIPNR